MKNTKTNQTSKQKTYLAEIVLGDFTNPTKVTRVHQVTGLDKSGVPNLKRVNARNFSRGLNNSRLVIA